MAELAESMVDQLPTDIYPRLTEFTHGHVLQPGYEFGHSFDVGLELVLNGLEQAAALER